MKPKKSIPNNINMIELKKNEHIKNKTEFIGLTADIIKMDELIKDI